MADLYARLSNLESIIFATLGVESAARVQNVKLAGSVVLTVQGGLVLIEAPGSIQATLAQPTVGQNGIVLVILTANDPGPESPNTITTAANGITDNAATNPKFSHVLSDNGVPGALVKLIAQNGLWIFGAGGSGWSAS
jgi:hypothetical protein